MPNTGRLRFILLAAIVTLVTPLNLLAQSEAPTRIETSRPLGSPLENPNYDFQRLEGRPWDLSVRAFLGYNDNVPLVPHSTFFTADGKKRDRSSLYGGLTLDGNYRFLQKEDYLLGVGLNVNEVVYVDRWGEGTVPRNYNLTTANPNLFGRYFFGLALDRWIMPASLGMKYAYRRDWLGYKPEIWFTSSNNLQWDLTVDVIRQLRLGLNYNLSFIDFNPKASFFNQRDATAHAVGLTGTYLIQGGLRSITLGYQYGVSNAKGRNFDVDGSNGLNLQFKSRVYGPLWAVVDGGWTWEDYKGFIIDFIPPPGRKWQRIDNYGLTFIYVVTDHINVDLFYRYTGWVSNQRQFEAHRNNGGSGVTYRF
jgi:hypothetical protein